MSPILWSETTGCLVPGESPMYEIPNEPIDLKEYDGLSGRSPVPFYIGIKPRHENVAKVLEGIEI